MPATVRTMKQVVLDGFGLGMTAGFAVITPIQTFLEYHKGNTGWALAFVAITAVAWTMFVLTLMRVREAQRLDRLRRCPRCTKPATEEMTETYVEYGVPVSVRVPVTHPVLTCATCEMSWYDYRGEEARDAAVETYRKTMGWNA